MSRKRSGLRRGTFYRIQEEEGGGQKADAVLHGLAGEVLQSPEDLLNEILMAAYHYDRLPHRMYEAIAAAAVQVRPRCKPWFIEEVTKQMSGQASITRHLK